MANPKISYPATFTPAHAMAFASADNTAATVSISNPLPVALGDGALAGLGALGDAAASSDTASVGLIALFKRLLGKLPASIGQKAAAASLPVVLASDQGAIPALVDAVSDGAITNGSATSAATVVTLNTAGFGGGSFQITGIGTSNTVSFEQSNDNATWIALPVNPASATTAAPVTTATATGLFNFIATAAYVRARLSTYGSGTVAITATQKRSRAAADQIAAAVLTTSSAQVGYTLNNTGYTDSTTALAASATYTGTGRSTSGLVYATRFKARAYADATGTLYIDQSLDSGSTWQVVASGVITAGVALDLGVAITGAFGSANQFRVRCVNGAAAQTLLRLSSVYTTA